ncbi:hypothetical protein CPB83DRAFT_651282 [Crepidotus variabilis]|uniref:Uncharacterized protein n=1 Tax=Crepidotus variabilis TaxID=179855 RepID=A0A9P6E735_9AGAR|nr:hypothetical protein CPB83DRAFT_651282 [Crepidotus variabilis]
MGSFAPAPVSISKTPQARTKETRKKKPNLWLPLSPYATTSSMDGAVESVDDTQTLSVWSTQEKSVFEDWDDGPRSSIIFGEDTVQTLLSTPDTPYLTLPPSARKHKQRLGAFQQVPVSAVTPRTPFFSDTDSEDESEDGGAQLLSASSSCSSDSNKTPVPGNFRGPQLSINTSLDKSGNPVLSSEDEFTLSALLSSIEDSSSPEGAVRPPDVLLRNEIMSRSSQTLAAQKLRESDNLANTTWLTSSAFP